MPRLEFHGALRRAPPSRESECYVIKGTPTRYGKSETNATLAECTRHTLSVLHRMRSNETIGHDHDFVSALCEL